MSLPSPQDRYVTSCPVGCGADFEVTDIALPEGRLLRCRACGQLASQITESAYWASMRAFDAPDHNLPDEHAADRRMENATRRLTRVCELLAMPASEVRLLDVCCSRGDFVAAAQTLGFDAEGVEPAPHIAQAGRAAGRRIHSGRLEEQGFPDGRFDAATLFEVIEHLREPIPMLREIRRILKPGGVLLLSTGNGASWTARVLKQAWDYFQISVDAGHISFFNPGSLALLGQRAGFAVADLYTARVRLVIKGRAPAPVYAAGKLAAELLNYPARLFGRGHDMIAYLRRVG
jgi:2-polyprenyl-3-methyl-5-hydroxy-6-metoxy-1,4-benzoquinol methylase